MPRLPSTNCKNSADVFFAGENGGENYWLFDFFDYALIGPARWVIDFDQFAIGLGDFVADAGRGGDQRQIEFAFQALLNNFHVEQAEEAAAKTESEGDGTFGFVEK